MIRLVSTTPPKNLLTYQDRVYRRSVIRRKGETKISMIHWYYANTDVKIEYEFQKKLEKLFQLVVKTIQCMVKNTQQNL